MRPTLHGSFREVVGLESKDIFKGDYLGMKQSDLHRVVIDVWRLSVREILLYS